MSICFCLRLAPFGWSPGRGSALVHACSPAHIEIAQRYYGKPDAMTEIEVKAREKAGEMLGEYLDHLNKTDLAAFTPDEFDMLLKTVIESYKEAVDEMCQPFGVGDTPKQAA